jgi:peptidoglycan/LPS O-acetylase OafA/YrhL
MSMPQTDGAPSDLLPARPRSGLWRLIADIPQRFRREVSNGAYRPEIDGLRFFAIAIVVFGHLIQRVDRFMLGFRAVADEHALVAHMRIGPGLGVYLFFTISGFIIATQARRAKESPLSSGFLKAYFGRRVLRIEPPYMILLVATWLMLTLTGYRPEGTQQFFTRPESLDLSLVSSLFYVHDLVWGAFPRLFPPGWSLEAEVQFYVLAPALFWLWFKLQGARSRFLFAAGVLFATTLLSTCVPNQIGPVFVYFSILRFFPMFFLGVVLADLRVWLTEAAADLPALGVTALGWLGLACFAFLPEIPDSPTTGGLLLAAMELSIIAMFASAFAPQSGFRWFCARPWIALIGGACYSIYLVHIQLLQTITLKLSKLAPNLSFAGSLGVIAVEIVIVIAVGLVFYALIERPFMMPNWHWRLIERLGLMRPPSEPQAVAQGRVVSAVMARVVRDAA